MTEVFQKDRKHCGKMRNCSLRAISSLSPVFSKDLYCRHIKPALVWERVKMALNIKLKAETNKHTRPMRIYSLRVKGRETEETHNRSLAISETTV